VPIPIRLWRSLPAFIAANGFFERLSVAIWTVSSGFGRWLAVTLAGWKEGRVGERAKP